jgi:hypothetical protein
MLIEDDAGDVPFWLKSRVFADKVLVFQNFFMAPDNGLGIVSISAASADDLVHSSYTVASNPGLEDLDDNWWTINGCYKPTITVQVGNPGTRWRLISAGGSVLLASVALCTVFGYLQGNKLPFETNRLFVAGTFIYTLISCC